jgi:hypothetical protein
LANWFKGNPVLAFSGVAIICLLLGYSANNFKREGGSESAGISDLNSAELFTRPGVADYGFSVGALWACFSQLRTGPARIIDTTRTGSSDIKVRIQFADGKWSDWNFHLNGDKTALLYGIDASDGSRSQDPGVLKMSILMLGQNCAK